MTEEKQSFKASFDDFETPRYRWLRDMCDKLVYKNPTSVLAAIFAIATALAQILIAIFPNQAVIFVIVIYVLAFLVVPGLFLTLHYRRYKYKPSAIAKQILLAVHQSAEKDLICCWIGNEYVVSSWDRSLSENEGLKRSQLAEKETITLEEPVEIMVADKKPILTVRTDYEQRRLQAIIQNELIKMGFFELNPNKQLNPRDGKTLDLATTLVLGLTPRGEEYAYYLIDKQAQSIYPQR